MHALLLLILCLMASCAATPPPLEDSTNPACGEAARVAASNRYRDAVRKGCRGFDGGELEACPGYVAAKQRYEADRKAWRECL